MLIHHAHDRRGDFIVYKAVRKSVKKKTDTIRINPCVCANQITPSVNVLLAAVAVIERGEEELETKNKLAYRWRWQKTLRRPSLLK